MHRTQLMLKEEQYRYLADEAQRRGISISALLREWIEARMQDPGRAPLKQDPLWDLVGIGHGGEEQVSEEHDRYLADARSRRSPGRNDADAR